MKILIITQLYPGTPDKNRKDPRRAIHAFARQWARHHEVRVIRQHNYRFFTAWIWWLRRLPSQYTLDGVVVYNRLAIRWPLGGWSLDRVESVARAYQPDLIIAHILESAYSANRIHHKLGVPYAMGLHNSDIRKSGAARGHITGRAHRLMQEAVFVSFRSMRLQRVFLSHAPYLKNKSGVIPGGVPAHWIGTVQREFRFADRPIRIVTVSRLLPQKNIHKVISALAALSGIDLEYRIIGAGMWPYRQQLARMIRRYGLGDKVSLEGLKQPEEVRQTLETADIMVMISENETFGLVYLEAMSRGCLTIGTRGEGIDGTIVDGKNGFLCEPSAEALSHLLKRIIDMDPAQLLEISDRALDTAREYQHEDIADRYLRRVLEHLRTED